MDVATNIQPSARWEHEITTVNQKFLEDGELKVQTLGRGFAWLDTGTHDLLSGTSTYIEVLEKRQGLKVACLEGIAYSQVGLPRNVSLNWHIQCSRTSMVSTFSGLLMRLKNTETKSRIIRIAGAQVHKRFESSSSYYIIIYNGSNKNKYRRSGNYRTKDLW